MAELVDAWDLKSQVERREGSNPSTRIFGQEQMLTRSK